MSESDIDYNSAEWDAGYRAGYLGETPSAESMANPSYKDGWITGNAEQDAPEEYIEASLFAERQKRVG